MKTDKIAILLENSPEENFMFHFFGLASCSLLLSFSLLQRRPYVFIIGYYMIAFHNFSIYIECQTVKNVKTIPTITRQLPNVAPTSNISLCHSSLHSVTAVCEEKLVFGDFSFEVHADIKQFCNWC